MICASYDVACLKTLPEKTMFRMLRILPFALAFAALSIFTACGGSSGTKFRLVNAIPDLLQPQQVDVLIDGKSVETGVSFPAVTPSTGYLSVGSGSHKLEVRQTGQTTSASDYFQGTVAFNGGTTYTVVATGNVGNNTVVAPLLTDNNTAPTSGNAELRIIQASPSGLSGLQSVDIYLVSPGTTDISSISPSISNVGYQTASTYLNVPAASYDILITATGIKAINIDDQNVSFAAGKIYTYVLVDVPNGGAMSQNPLPLTDN
jgi:hypothetical protein